MDDSKIIELFFARSEEAIKHVADKYTGYLMSIARNILFSIEDSSECVNDTYFRAWNTIPPQKPARLNFYLGKITRELSIDRWRRRNAEKRGAGEYAVSLDELSECIPDNSTPDDALDMKLLAKSVGDYLRTLNDTARNTFIFRYYHCDSIKQIAQSSGMSEEKVKSVLFRTRAGLKKYLESEGFTL